MSPKLDPLAASMAFAQRGENPINDFEHTMETFIDDFALTRKELLKLWEFCSEHLMDPVDGFKRLSKVVCREKALRAAPSGDRKLWRSLVQYTNTFLCQTMFRQYFSSRKLSGARSKEFINAVQKNASIVLQAIAIAVREAIADISRTNKEAAHALEESYNQVLAEFDQMFTNAKESLKQYAL